MNWPYFLEMLADNVWSVVVAVAPLALLFLVFQALLLKLPTKEVARILVGTLLAAAGLLLFLTGVSLAFLPFGRLIGQAIGAAQNPGLILATGLALGLVTAWGEPAVRILAGEIESASGGSIPRTLVVLTICAGVSVSVGVGLLRVAYDIPVSYILVPGYVMVMVVMWFSEKDFIAIAADAGGVATGPLANSFLLALALGISSAMEGQDPLVHGLGLVALIAMTPILSIMTLGLLMRRRTLTRRT